MKGIYKITSPSNYIYIGQTSNSKVRKHQYKYKNCKVQKALYNSINKYGWSNHEFEMLELIEDNDLLDIQEEYYYNLYSSLGFTMLNIMKPGIKGNRKHSQESKDLISFKNSEYKITQFSLNGEFIKVWNSCYEGAKSLNLTTKNIRSNIYGYTKRAGKFIFKKGEIYNNIDAIKPNKKRLNNNSTRKGVRLKRPVYQYNLNGEFIKEWFSMKEAGEVLNLNSKYISNSCNEVTKQTGGFKWSTIKL